MTDNPKEESPAPPDPKDSPSQDAPLRASRTWMETHGRDLRFIIVGGLMMSLYYFATTTDVVEKQFFKWYLETTAAAGGAVLKTFGYENVRVVGAAMDTVDKTVGTITVERGCDAIAPTALFLSAVIASPAGISSKLIGMVAGTFILMLVNLIRIITLFLTAVHWRSIFDLMHLDIWQWAFIALSVLLWLLWASWATKRRRRQLEAAAST